MTAAVTAAGQLYVVDPTKLIPHAARAGYVPVTDLPWLEELRGRHDELAGRLAVAVRVPARVREEHAAMVAGWRAEVRAAARVDAPPPVWDARMTEDWLAGRVDAAEVVIADLVEQIGALLCEADANCEEHGV